MSEAESQIIWHNVADEHVGSIRIARPITAAVEFNVHLPSEDYPAWYRRTFSLAVAFGPLIAGIAGLFDRDCMVWVMDNGKFSAVRLTKRALA